MEEGSVRAVGRAERSIGGRGGPASDDEVVGAFAV